MRPQSWAQFLIPSYGTAKNCVLYSLLIEKSLLHIQFAFAQSWHFKDLISKAKSGKTLTDGFPSPFLLFLHLYQLGTNLNDTVLIPPALCFFNGEGARVVLLEPPRLWYTAWGQALQTEHLRCSLIKRESAACNSLAAGQRLTCPALVS